MKRLQYTLQILVLTVCTPMLLHAQGQGDCTIYNISWSSPIQSTSDDTQHLSGNHSATGAVTGSCTYQGTNKSGACNVQCAANAYVNAAEAPYSILNDTGSLLPLMHSVTGKPTFGGAGGNAAAATCGGEIAAGAQSCVAVTGCSLTITFSGGGAGIGASVTYSNPVIWSYSYPYQHTCGIKESPGCVPGPVPPPQGPDGGWIWNPYPTCGWQWLPIHGATPIIIDTDGSGFHLTSAAKGIRWDFYGDGVPIQIAWTAPGSTNGWLAMPDSDGRITSARQLFSNIAAQNLNNGDNGFNALAFYDTNGDGVVDKNDAQWEQLRVWIDANHDGVSQPNELLTLDSLGITSISLNYTSSPRTDQYGNQFMLKGHLGEAPGDDVNRVIYDVTLATQ